MRVLDGEGSNVFASEYLTSFHEPLSPHMSYWFEKCVAQSLLDQSS